MTLDVLQKSHIGISVNKLRQKFPGSDLASLAKKLIKSWRKLLPSKDEKASSSSPGNAQSDYTSSQQATPTFKTSPPPVAYSPSKNSAPSINSNSSITSSASTAANGETPGETMMSPIAGPSRSDSVSSDCGVVFFAPNIVGESRVMATGDGVRDRCRELLAKAMMKGFEKVTIEEEIKFHNLASEIEDCVFSEFRDTGNKYKQRIRSRVSNLGDQKNPSLKMNVMSGTIGPSKIATMTTEEMASDSMKKLRKQLTKEAIRDSQISMQGGTETDLLKCSKCRNRKCTYTQAQTRSADEPMTTFAFCLHCGHRWKFC
jgi:transcription elongation factor S-II